MSVKHVKCKFQETQKAVSFDLGQISLKAIFKYPIILVGVPFPSSE